jgi:predicted dehydrogenase
MARKRGIGVGVIGCGNIAPAYFKGMSVFETLKVEACADLDMAAARARADEFGCAAQTVDELLANERVQLVVNLTVPAVHAAVSRAALKAGKHVHVEKPLAVSMADGRAVLAEAARRNLRVGCAPDTFLGAGLQTCRKLVDDGWIGRVTSGAAFMLARGPESWHPNPAFFYRRGAGPMFDMGPYYLTALVHLLGPVKRVAAITGQAFSERVATCKQHFGERLPVEVPTHYAGVLEFHAGAVVTLTVSFDVHRHGHAPIELYGTDGSLRVPDPNTFGGPVEMFTPGSGEWQPQALSHRYAQNMRGIGPADMACAILGRGREHRASGDLALHVLEIMHAFEKASVSGRHVPIRTRPAQPKPLPLGLIEGRLDP